MSRRTSQPSTPRRSTPRPIRREVTPLVFPIDLESEAGRPALGDSSGSSVRQSGPRDDHPSLDDVWSRVRQMKEESGVLSISPPKVQSLEVEDDYRPETQTRDRAVSSPDRLSTLPRPKIKRRRSIMQLRESPDGTTMTAVFDMCGVKKNDMHVSFRGSQLVVTWQTSHITEGLLEGVLVRDRETHHYNRIIPLPLGTTFSEIRASKETGALTVTFPNSRIVRVD